MKDQAYGAAIKLCQDLIRCPSDSGAEKEAAETLQKAMLDLGFDKVDVDRYGNVIGQIKGKQDGPCVLLDGHIDTVPVVDAELWSQNPYGGDLVDGKIYGRGASDMKGAVAAMAVAATEYAKACDGDFAGKICVVGAVHEECFEGVASREISKLISPDYVVIGEASELNLKIGQRGRAEIVVETFGRPAHSASPEKGINAVHMMMKLVERIEKFVPRKQKVLGEGICVLTDIISSPYPGASVVPSNCRVTYDRRLLVDEDEKIVLEPFIEAIARCQADDSDFSAKVYFAAGQENCYTGAVIEAERFFPAWLHDEKEDFIQDVLAGLGDIGINPNISHYAFCTNGSHYAGELGIKTFGFGPSQEHLAHTTDEYIEVVQLQKGVNGYVAILGALLHN